MIKKCQILILTLLLATQALAQALPVQETIQEESEWCWAGVSKCLLDYYNKPIEQCQIAEYARQNITWHNFGTANCCVVTSQGCNYWNYNWGEAGSIKDILINLGGIQNNGLSNVLSWNKIQTEIDNYRPFIIRWGWRSGGGHFLVIHGTSGESDIHYMNPWFGEGFGIATYEWMQDDGNHEWTHQNVMTTTPIVIVLSASELTIGTEINSQIEFSINSNTNWTITSSADWLTSNMQSGAGTANNIRITATARPSAYERVATITVSDNAQLHRSLRVYQPGLSVSTEIATNTPTITYAKASNQLIINKLETHSNMRIFASNGKLVRIAVALQAQETLELSGLANGVYTLRIDNNKASSNHKFVIAN